MKENKCKIFKLKSGVILLISAIILCVAACSKTSTSMPEIKQEETVKREETVKQEEIPAETTKEEQAQTQKTETETHGDEVANIIPIILYNENKDFTADDGFSVLISSYETAYIDGIGVLNIVSEDNLDTMYADAKDFYETWDPQYGEFLKYESAESISIGRADSCIISLIQTDYAYMGGAHGSSVISGINYDAKTGKKLWIDDLSDDTENFAKICLSEIKKQAEEMNMETNNLMLFNGYDDALPGLVRENNISFDNNGIIIYAQQYEIAPYASGIIEFNISYDKLSGVLKDVWMPQTNNEDNKKYIIRRIGEPSRKGIAQSAAQGMISSLIDWTGYQYANNTGVLDGDIMSDENIIRMTGTALVSAQVLFNTQSGEIGYNMESYDENSGTYTFSKDKADEYAMNYFGRTIDIDILNDDGLYRSDADNLCVSVGDWGMSSPVAVFTQWEEDYDKDEMVQYVDYYMSDNMSKCIVRLKYTYSYEYDALYRMTIKDITRI